MKKWLYVTLITIALGLGYVRVRYSQAPTQGDAPTPSASVLPLASNNPVLTKELTNDYFTILYHSEATTRTGSAPDSAEWTINYMGKEQLASGRTQTELWDGYALSITRFESVGENPDSMQAEADRDGIIEACSSENVTEIKQGLVGQYEALTFYGGCLGEADYYYLMIADTLYRVTVMVVGSDSYKPEYQSITVAMLNSLKFE